MGKIPLFAKDLQGYKNLIKLSSKSFLAIKDDEEPHCKIEDIEANYKGLILLSGSFDGLIGQLFFKNLTDEIFVLFKKFKSIFRNNLYLEIQRHNESGEKLFEKFLLNISEKLELLSDNNTLKLELANNALKASKQNTWDDYVQKLNNFFSNII